MFYDLCVALFAIVGLVGGAEWSYSGDTGPESWATNFGECSGMEQSPIDIVTKDAVVDDGLLEILLSKNYYHNDAVNMTYKNNGHTLQVDVTEGLYIEGSKFENRYNLLQFHFHWGTTDSTGSDHTLNGKQYPLEVHLVHWSSAFQNVSEAVDQPDGIAVLGAFFEIGEKENPVFNQLLDLQESVKYKGWSTRIPTDFPIRSILPLNLRTYFRYDGSLTTPPCHVSVRWTVFHDTVKITKAQLARFRSVMRTENGTMPEEPLVDTYRPIQALGGRPVSLSLALPPKPPVITPEPCVTSGTVTVEFHALALLCIVLKIGHLFIM